MVDVPDLLAAVSADLPPGYSLRPTRDPDHDWLGIEAVLPTGEVRLLAWTSDEDDGHLLDGLRTAQCELIEHELGEAWPRCPVHGTHPLRPGPGGWACPADSAGRWDYGSLSSVPVAPEPNRDDGEVRWWLDDLGWGLIAHHGGDVWVHISAIEGSGYRTLQEGERVEYRLSGSKQAKFAQRAEWVRRTSQQAGP